MHHITRQGISASAGDLFRGRQAELDEEEEERKGSYYTGVKRRCLAAFTVSFGGTSGLSSEHCEVLLRKRMKEWKSDRRNGGQSWWKKGKKKQGWIEAALG